MGSGRGSGYKNGGMGETTKESERMIKQTDMGKWLAGRVISMKANEGMINRMALVFFVNAKEAFTLGNGRRIRDTGLFN